MKKKYIPLVLMGLLLLALVACTNTDGNDNDLVGLTSDQGNQIADAINSLQVQIDSLEETLGDFMDRNENPQVSDDTGNKTAVEDASSLDTTNVVLPTDFSEYKTKAENLKNEVINNKDTKISRYHELRNQINTLDRELDVFDDKIENDFESSKIGLEDYTSYEKQLDEIEDILDQAEDLLEKQFGIND